MNDDERAAREWLREVIEEPRWPEGDPLPNVARTILRLLDRPVLPRPGEIPLEVWDAMFNAAADNPPDSSIPDMAAAYAVLHAHLTAPPPAKKVEAWVAVNASGNILAFSDGPDAAALICEGARIVRLVEAADD